MPVSFIITAVLTGYTALHQNTYKHYNISYHTYSIRFDMSWVSNQLPNYYSTQSCSSFDVTDMSPQVIASPESSSDWHVITTWKGVPLSSTKQNDVIVLQLTGSSTCIICFEQVCVHWADHLVFHQMLSSIQLKCTAIYIYIYINISHV